MITAALHKAIPSMEGMRFSHPLTWQIGTGEHWAVIGPNGAGKSLLIDLLLGRLLLKEGRRTFRYGSNISEWVKTITFNDLYTLPGIRESYYQQRWNSADITEVPTVRSLLGNSGNTFFDPNSNFYLGKMSDKPVLALSCGEMRKFLIVRAMLAAPKLLVLDNPYVGLDVASRSELSSIFKAIAAQGQMQLLFLLSDPADIPEAVTHVLPVKERTLLPSLTREAFLSNAPLINRLFDLDNTKDISFPFNQPVEGSSAEMARLDKVTIRYGENVLLNEISWQINRGEQWLLYGPNGSGKSTLISLLYGDNPQAYAQKVYLFGRKRGTGESIWDIKRPIGYLSPEMQLYFNTPLPAAEVVASGFFDTMGLFRKPTTGQYAFALDLMESFGIKSLSGKLFTLLSSGEQRLVLLCRALVKEPEFLILDEPMQGLDLRTKQVVKSAIDQFVNRDGRTLLYVSHNTPEIPLSAKLRLSLPEGMVQR